MLLISINLTSTLAVLAQQEHLAQDSLAANRIETNLSIAEYFLNSQPSMSLIYADSAEKSSERISYHDGLYKSREIKGIALKKRRNYEQAINYFDKALDVANITRNYNQEAKCYYEIGEIHLELKNHEQAYQNYQRALINENKITSKVVLASLYAGLWTVHWHREDFSEALKYQDKALKIYHESAGNKEILNILSRIGNAFKKANKLDEALEYYLKTIDTKAGKYQDIEIANIWINVGEIYSIQKNHFYALKYFNKAEDLLKQRNKKEELVNLYLHKGRLFNSKKNYGEATKIIQEANDIATETRNLEYQATGNLILSEIYENIGDIDSSYLHYKLYTGLKEQLLNEEIAHKIADIASNYEFNQKEREINLLAKEKELAEKEANVQRLNNRIKGYIIGLLTLLILSISALSYVIYKEYQAKQKANEIIKTQMEEITLQKQEVEKQRDIISKNNLEMEKAQRMIGMQNTRLKEINEHLEEKVVERTKELSWMFQKLSFHIDNTPLAIMEWNDQLEITRWSKQAESIFGYTAEEILGKTTQALPIVHKDDRETLNELMENLLNKKKPRNFSHIKGLHKNGDIIFLEWSNSVLFDTNEKMQSILTIANDVSDREKAHLELKELNQELDNFIYHASHDLQGPLSRMQGLIYLGKAETKDKTSEMYFNMLGVVNNELNKILSSLRMVYNFYQRALIIEKINVKNVIVEIVEKVKDSKKIEGIDFRVNISSRTFWYVDKMLFDMIIENLIHNAMCYKADINSFLEFSIEKNNGGGLHLIVRDNGIGIPEEQASRIFDLFFRGTLNPNEAGINLYMAKKAINRLGGGIALMNPVNDTIFELIIPDMRNASKETIKMV